MNIEKKSKNFLSRIKEKEKEKEGQTLWKTIACIFTNIRPQVRNISLKLRVKSPSFVPL